MTIRKDFPLTVILAVLVYLSCTLIAYLQFPAGYSPARNWLSDLGNANQNPGGAGFYNLGVILTGLLVCLFFTGISHWQMQGKRVQKLMVRLAQFFGVLGGLAMVMSALFPINLPQHEFWSIALYVLLGTAFIFSAAALRYQPRFPIWGLALGFLTAGTDILSSFFHESTLLEWLTVGLFLVYLVVLGVKTKALQDEG